MKIVGLILMSVGLALLAFVLYAYFKNSQELVSPIPDQEGVRVIFVTPRP